VLVASYCGVVIISFTGGNSGAIWLAPELLLLVGLVVIWRPTAYAFGSKTMARFTYMMFLVFLAGVVVALLRFDPELEVAKAGAFRTLLGVPVKYLMTMYRLHTIAFLALAFFLPLHYYIDRKLFLQLLILCWLFSVVLAVSGILHYTRLADFAFSYGMLPTYETSLTVLFGFRRGAHGPLLVTGIFMSFAMTQLTRSYNLKILGYISIPILLIALLFSFSRAALVAILVGGVSLAATLGGARAFKGILISLFSAIVIYIVLTISPVLRERFLSFIGPAGKTMVEFGGMRITGWISVAKWLSESPGVVAVGTGFQNFAYFIKLNPKAGQIGLGAGHNSWLHALTEFGVLGFIVFNAWLASIFYWLVSWRRMMTDKIDKMMPGIFISLMLAITVSCLTQESLVPSTAVVPWMVHFYIILGIWTSYYRTQMLENFGDLEYLDSGQYAYDQTNCQDETLYETEQYHDYNYIV